MSEKLYNLPPVSERKVMTKTVKTLSDGLDRIKKEWKQSIIDGKLLGDYNETIAEKDYFFAVYVSLGTDCIGTVEVLTEAFWVEWIVNPNKIIEVL